jgi:hypothetical protein
VPSAAGARDGEGPAGPKRLKLSGNDLNERPALPSYDSGCLVQAATSRHSLCPCCHRQLSESASCLALCYDHFFSSTACRLGERCHMLHSVNKGARLRAMVPAFPDRLLHLDVVAHAPLQRGEEVLSALVDSRHRPTTAPNSWTFSLPVDEAGRCSLSVACLASGRP